MKISDPDPVRTQLLREAQRGGAKLLVVGARTCISIEGRGAPGGEAFLRAAALLQHAGAELRAARRADGRDFRLGEVECLSWTGPRGGAHWKALLAVPGNLRPHELALARKQVARRHPGAADLQLEQLPESTCVEVLARGAGDESDEDAQQFARLHGLPLTPGRKHQLFLSDPVTTPPEQLRAVALHPVVRAPAPGAVREPGKRPHRMRARGVPAAWRQHAFA